MQHAVSSEQRLGRMLVKVERKIDKFVKSLWINTGWLSRKFNIRPAGSALGVQGAAVF